VIKILIATVFETEYFVHRIVEETADAGAAYTGRFGFRIKLIWTDKCLGLAESNPC
jgi:hypothetical protein